VLDKRSDVPEQYRAVGWVGSRLHSVILEVRKRFFISSLCGSRRQRRSVYKFIKEPSLLPRRESLGSPTKGTTFPVSSRSKAAWSSRSSVST
jgi:hypothetical protein